METTESDALSNESLRDRIDRGPTVPSFPLETPAGSPERPAALDRMGRIGRTRKVSDMIIPEEGPQPPERGVLHQRLREAAAEGTVLAVKYGVVLLLWLYAGFMVGRAYVDLEGQRAQATKDVKELKEQMSTVGPQALRGQQAFQFLAANEKAMVAIVNAENARQKAAPKQ